MNEDGWEELVRSSIEKRKTISTAESCTGGYIANLITNTPGSSGCFLGGVVAYSNDLKSDILGVKEETLETFGSVSRETAAEMSRGIQERTGSDIGLSVTGIAGPSGGTEEKPVGTVFISVHLRDGRTVTEGFLLEGLTRSEFKEEVSERALGMLLGSFLMS
ncbi:MAG: CinA family protein [Thermoplasmatota archaeon]